jgi:hypothetical protein
MDPREEALRALPPHTVEELLDLLVQLRERGAGEVAVPLTTFHLGGGRDVTGYLLSLGRRPGRGAVATVHVPGHDRGRPAYDVAYLDPARIEAVTIHDAAAVAHVLSGGRVPPPATPGVAAPTRLQLKRRTVEVAEEIGRLVGAPLAVDIAWDGIGEDLRGPERLLEDAAAVLRALAADELARAALAQQVRVVVLADGPPGATRSGEALRLTATFDGGPLGRLAPPDLRAAIERLL